MDLDTRIKYCLQRAMSMTAAQLYDKYVAPYGVRRQAKTSEDLARDAFQAGTVVNQKLVELFSLALKNLIGVKGEFGPMGVEGFLNQNATGEKLRDRESQKPLVTRRGRGRRTACSPKSLRTASAVPIKRTTVEANEPLVTSENFDGPPGFPWWPAMVDLDASGRYARFDPKTHIATHYNVIFLDPCKSTTKLLPASSLCKFTQMNKADVIRKAGRHSKKVAAAFQEAEEALKVSIEIIHCSPSPPTSCSTSTLDLAQFVDQKPKESAVFETRMENEKVGTAEVNIDELMTTVLYDTQDWSSERMYRAFMPHRYCPLSPIDRTVS
ncbi:unnamed protein product [Dibothriocephalus latus]|uniref:PWWP domain-containing protein n=1 Tax=Dibothriocephalus latus TaxID=60516 RepID=A0A3P7LZ63_DIBLA|nr:unnamed protein product [Dibothriocephalus latus]